MDKGLLIDATVLIDHLRGHPDATAYLSPLVHSRTAVLHPAVLAEVLSGARDARHLRMLDGALSRLRLLTVRGDDLVRTVDLFGLSGFRRGLGGLIVSSRLPRSGFLCRWRHSTTSTSRPSAACA